MPERANNITPTKSKVSIPPITTITVPPSGSSSSTPTFEQPTLARQQVQIWTPLPRGVVNGRTDEIYVGVLVTPQLSNVQVIDYREETSTELGYFPDWVNWPNTVANASGPLSFEIFINDSAFGRVDADLSGLEPKYWSAMFGANTTRVDSYGFDDFTSTGTTTFDATALHTYVTQGVYQPYAQGIATTGATATATTTDPTQLVLAPGSKPAVSSQAAPTAKAAFNSVYSPAGSTGYADALTFHQAPANNSSLAVPTVPILDFHSAISSLNSHPELLRFFGLVFPVVVKLPSSVVSSGGDFTLTMVPTWQSLGGDGALKVRSIDVPMTTNCNLGGGRCVTASSNDPTGLTYEKGSLNLNLDNIFSIIDLDVDRAAHALDGLNQSITSTQSLQGQNQEITLSYSLPSLRSSGPSVIWRNWGASASDNPGGLLGLNARQKKINAAVADFVANPGSKRSPSASLYAEDVTRGWRFDVRDTTPGVGTNTWQSLHWRLGTYTFGVEGGTQYSHSSSVPVEGEVNPAASHAPADDISDISSLFVHEMIMKWTGWGLSAVRPGSQVDDATGQITAPVGNPAVPTSYTDEFGNYNPQLGASYRVAPAGVTVHDPDTGAVIGTTGLPVLRYGHTYELAARLVDLSGWSIAQGQGLASPTVTHARWEAVKSPVVVPVAPLTAGEGVHTIVLRNDGVNPVEPSARWLFPPRVPQLLAEEHGKFDTDGVPDPSLYQEVASFADGSLSSLPGITVDNTIGTPNQILPTTIRPYTLADGTSAPVINWIPDPASAGFALYFVPPPGYTLSGLAAVYAGANGFTKFDTDVPYLEHFNPLAVFVDLWEVASGKKWPYLEGKQLQFLPGTTPAPGSPEIVGDGVVAPVLVSKTNLAGSPEVVAMVVVPGSVFEVHLSSVFSADDAADAPTNVFSLVPSVRSALQAANFTKYETLALLEGQLPQITPFKILRVVHAVLQPLTDAKFSSELIFSRSPSQTFVTLNDPKYGADLPSTVSVTYTASWTDHIDNPADASNNPGTDTASVTQGGLVVATADLYAPAVDNDPIVPTLPTPPTSQIPFGTVSMQHDLSAVHRIGDTKHHSVTYAPVAASRFAQFFQQQIALTLTDETPVVLDSRGIDVNLVVVTDAASGKRIDSSNYTLDATAGTIHLNNTEDYERSPLGFFYKVSVANALSGVPLTVYYVPTDTRSGPNLTVDILSTTAPPPIKVARVAPAWSLTTSGSSPSPGGYSYRRTGNTLRVYIERPWYVTGNNEMVGVITPAFDSGDQIEAGITSNVSLDDISLLGLDPISVGSPSTPYSQTELSFITPDQVPASGKYFDNYQLRSGNPVQVPSALDPTGRIYFVWGYNPQYDSASGHWFVDIQLDMTKFENSPPPGYFVRLALARFQPYSISGVGSTDSSGTTYPNPLYLSKTTLVTYAQLVSDRAVTVVGGAGSPVTVTVSGPGYYGYRPATFEPQKIYNHDTYNDYATHPNSDHKGSPHSSTMVVEVQEYSQPNGFSGDFGWTTTGHPVVLTPSFDGSPTVQWKTANPITLPQTSVALRLRISEIDYLGADPSTVVAVDTNYRRSFLAHVPVAGSAS